MDRNSIRTNNRDVPERVLLAIVTLHPHGTWTAEDDAQEMRELIESCGGQVVHTVFCKAMPPTPSHLITKGKVEEIKAFCALGGVDTVIFSTDLKGSQQRNLEEDFGAKTLDRTQVILDIFARHATSQEGKMQVELAQLQYLLPRLVGQYDQMSRLGGGIGTSGPGETKLEVDRRRIADRIAKLKRGLKEVTKSREVKRKKRKENEIPVVALVGYTNAGKSTLFNSLTGSKTRTHEGLFTTLDSLSRQTLLPNNHKVIFSDTVGFMHDLPHGLIEAFKATLEEVGQADLLLHVLDISNPNFRKSYAAVNAVLQELGVLNKTTIMVLNKIDKLSGQDNGCLQEFRKITSDCVEISAKTGENLNRLLLAIEDRLGESSIEVDVLLPVGRMDLVNLAHSKGQVHDVQYSNEGIHLKASLPAKTAALISRGV